MTRSDDSSPTPRLPISPALLRVAWMRDPATLAQHLTRGRYAIPPHVDLLSRAVVETVERGGRLLVQMPPRHSKSETCSVWTPVWFLNRWPERHVMLASYEADFAASFGRRTRNAIEQHRDELLVSLSEDSTAANRWHTPEGGGMVTAGVGGPLTGKGAHLLLVDDPHKNAEEAYSEAQQTRLWEWWTSTALTRLEPGAAVIVIQTRWHEGDLAGRILRHEGAAWRVLRLPAIADGPDEIGRLQGEALWPARYDVEALHQIRRSVGSRVWAAGYQQAPVADSGAVFKREWLAHRYTWLPDGIVALPGAPPVHWTALRRFATVDLALSTKTSADYSVMAVFGATDDHRLVLLDLDRARREGPDHVPALQRAVSRWRLPVVWIEKAGIGLGVVQEASRAGVPVRQLEADRDKLARALAATPLLERGGLLLPEQAPWVADVEAELLGFPTWRHDDVVDVIAYGARVAAEYSRTISVAVGGGTPDGRRITWHGSPVTGSGPSRHGPLRGRLFAR